MRIIFSPLQRSVKINAMKYLLLFRVSKCSHMRVFVNLQGCFRRVGYTEHVGSCSLIIKVVFVGDVVFYHQVKLYLVALLFGTI